MHNIAMFEFGLTPYGLFILDDIKGDTAVFKESVTSIVSFGRVGDIYAFYTEQVYANRMIISIARNDKAQYLESISGIQSISVLSKDKAVLLEEIGQKSALGLTFTSSAHFNEETKGKIALGSDLVVYAIGAETVNGNIALGSDIVSTVVCAENVGVNVSILHITTEIMTITATIPPNGKITINTADYTAWLNDDTNIIHLVEGDWARLSRNTRHIEIEGAVDGEILYTARWI